MILPVHLGEKSYDIVLERGGLSKAGKFFSLKRKVLVVTDSGVPEKYAQTVAQQCGDATVVTIPQGEESKNLSNWTLLLETMLKKQFTRADAVIAVGGGVVGDLSGFAASAFMRGIDFYNVPTTLLSQLDSSVGGKTAVDAAGVKNCIGAFWQPKGVLIDPDVLDTLDDRQFVSGLAEAVKMAATSDADLFCRMEGMRGSDFREQAEEILPSALQIKISVVERDEKENGLRRILNFGHTVGHAIESASAPLLTHGESVGLGMLVMSSGDANQRILNLLTRIGLPTGCKKTAAELFPYLLHDKKKSGDSISCVFVEEIGYGEIRKISVADFETMLEERLKTCFPG